MRLTSRKTKGQSISCGTFWLYGSKSCRCGVNIYMSATTPYFHITILNYFISITATQHQRLIVSNGKYGTESKRVTITFSHCTFTTAPWNDVIGMTSSEFTFRILKVASWLAEPGAIWTWPLTGRRQILTVVAKCEDRYFNQIDAMHRHKTKISNHKTTDNASQIESFEQKLTDFHRQLLNKRKVKIKHGGFPHIN